MRLQSIKDHDFMVFGESETATRRQHTAGILSAPPRSAWSLGLYARQCRDHHGRPWITICGVMKLVAMPEMTATAVQQDRPR